MIWVMLYVIIGFIVAAIGLKMVHDEGETAPIAAYLLVVVTWPLVLFLGIAKRLLGILMTEI